MKLLEKISKNLRNFVKNEKKQKKLDKEYLENLIRKEKKENKNITTLELSNKFGVDKETIENILQVEIEKVIPKNKNKKKRKKIKIKSLDKADLETIKEIFLQITLFGIPINFSLFVIFGIGFNLYSWIGWGIAFWLIKKEFVNIVRSLWLK